MILPEVRRLQSRDVPDLPTWEPERADYFGIVVQAMIGPKGADWEESFELILCTPSWLSERLGERDVRPGIHYLFVKAYDFGRVSRFIELSAARCQADAWPDVARALGQLARWEHDERA